MKRSGARSLVGLLVFATGCLYSLSGGGGIPSHIKTVAVIPFENQTANPELPTELHLELRKSILARLGLREAPEGRATAVLTGTITRYEPDIAVGFSADPARARTARRRLQLSINVDFVDKSTGKSLYKRDGLSADGEYDERDELAGRRQAIQRIISDIIEGAQSQW
jgi:hypothetical protein